MGTIKIQKLDEINSMEYKPIELNCNSFAYLLTNEFRTLNTSWNVKINTNQLVSRLEVENIFKSLQSNYIIFNSLFDDEEKLIAFHKDFRMLSIG